jgi:hypothetical protein
MSLCLGDSPSFHLTTSSQKVAEDLDPTMSRFQEHIRLNWERV